MTSAAFRFDADEHVYIEPLTGHRFPSITTMLKEAGLVDDRWFTPASCDRGHAVHQLTADYDLGALDPAACVSPYRGWLMGYVAAMQIGQPDWACIEIPMVHPTFRFGGRADRVGRVFGSVGVLEIKSGIKERAHEIQTALQAILVTSGSTAPESLARYAIYLTEAGKWQVQEHKNVQDFTEARALIRRFC